MTEAPDHPAGHLLCPSYLAGTTAYKIRKQLWEPRKNQEPIRKFVFIRGSRRNLGCVMFPVNTHVRTKSQSESRFRSRSRFRVWRIPIYLVDAVR